MKKEVKNHAESVKNRLLNLTICSCSQLTLLQTTIDNCAGMLF